MCFWGGGAGTLFLPLRPFREDSGDVGRGEQILIDYSSAVALQRVRESFLGRPLASETDEEQAMDYSLIRRLCLSWPHTDQEETAYPSRQTGSTKSCTSSAACG